MGHYDVNCSGTWCQSLTPPRTVGSAVPVIGKPVAVQDVVSGITGDETWAQRLCNKKVWLNVHIQFVLYIFMLNPKGFQPRALGDHV